MKEFSASFLTNYDIYDNFYIFIIVYADSTFMGQTTPTTAFDELTQYYLLAMYTYYVQRSLAQKNLLQNDSY